MIAIKTPSKIIAIDTIIDAIKDIEKLTAQGIRAEIVTICDDVFGSCIGEQDPTAENPDWSLYYVGSNGTIGIDIEDTDTDITTRNERVRRDDSVWA